ncbi:MAG: HAD-IIB family hydrolase [Candidatus Sungbacteria bacterium]|nr:HAD-IIB family hydrolase [Candidatus Sungbacteria bacterium]
MKISNLAKLKPKELIVFDIDGTLTLTKAPMDPEMATMIAQLLAVKKVAIIGGGKYGVFKEQLTPLQKLKIPKPTPENLFLFPATATSFYRYEHGWKKAYALQLSQMDRDKTKRAFRKVLKQIGYKHPKKVYGKVIEDRGTQVTFSALGQDVVAILGTKRGVYLKTKWAKENHDLKMKIAKLVGELLPNLEVRAAGFTSIDVTKKGIDKAYGLQQIEKHLHVHIKNMLFVGDAIFPGGNDYAIVRTGVDYIPVAGPSETKHIIKVLLKQK